MDWSHWMMENVCFRGVIYFAVFAFVFIMPHKELITALADGGKSIISSDGYPCIQRRKKWKYV